MVAEGKRGAVNCGGATLGRRSEKPALSPLSQLWERGDLRIRNNKAYD
jgi:hypothetical protein